MTNPNDITAIGTIKLLFLGGILAVLIGIALYGGEDKKSENEKDNVTTGALVESIKAGNEKINTSTKVMEDAGVYTKDTVGQDTLEPIPKDLQEQVLCPQYILPVLPELPELPPKEVMETISEAQLNFVLYQHIKAHQDRTIEVRKRIFKSYAEYLKSCE